MELKIQKKKLQKTVTNWSEDIECKTSMSFKRILRPNDRRMRWVWKCTNFYCIIHGFCREEFSASIYNESIHWTVSKNLNGNAKFANALTPNRLFGPTNSRCNSLSSLNSFKWNIIIIYNTIPIIYRFQQVNASNFEMNMKTSIKHRHKFIAIHSR